MSGDVLARYDEVRAGLETTTIEDELAAALRAAVGLLRELVDADECRYDHHAYCQTHALDPKPCPHARAKALLDACDQPCPTPRCTGLTADWCPNHGDCTCPDDGPGDDPACPLHSPTSTHAGADT